MRIQGNKLRAKAEQAGLSPEALAQAVERTGLSGERAVSAIKNWMRGADHPRCKAVDAQRLARALGCNVSEIVRFTTVLKYHRGSPRKTQLLTDMIRGKNAVAAVDMLQFSPKRAAVYVRKTLESAIEDARTANADMDSLVVAESHVGEGPRMKRFHPKDRGRAHAIVKDFCHITVGVEEKR